MTEIRIITGKGGVGKTASAVALGLSLSKQKKTVLVAEAQGDDSVARMLDVPGVGPDMREVLENLWVVDMRPEDSIHEYALLTLRFEALYRAVFRNRLVRHLIDMVPSLGELTMLGKVWYHAQQKNDQGRPRFDTIILDAPSTGHAIAMLSTPAAVARTVPAGAMRENCELIAGMLTAPTTRLHIVTTPEEMPVNEAKELERAANDVLGIKLGRTIINQRVLPLPSDLLERLEAQCPEILRQGAEALRVRQAKAKAGQEHLTRLPARMLDHCVNLPRVNSARFDQRSVEQLAAVITEQVGSW